MDLKKASVEGRLVDVVSFEKLEESKELYASAGNPTAVEVKTCTGEQFILPFNDRTTMSNDRAGVYPFGNVGYIIKYPDKKYKKEYQPDVIDFGDVDSIQGFINKQDRVKDVEREILCSPDNIYKPAIGEHDAPEMKAIKEAIRAKNIDIDKYADRFGENFPNDKRKLKDDKITLFLLKRMAECLDMNVDLIISDKNPNVPNPIGMPIKVSLTGNGEETE